MGGRAQKGELFFFKGTIHCHLRSETGIWGSGHLAPNSKAEAGARAGWNPCSTERDPWLSSISNPWELSGNAGLLHQNSLHELWSVIKNLTNFNLCHASFSLGEFSVLRCFQPATQPQHLGCITSRDISLPLLFGHVIYPVLSNWSGRQGDSRPVTRAFSSRAVFRSLSVCGRLISYIC